MMELEGQTSGEFDAWPWATQILHLPHKINTILTGSQQILFPNHCDGFKCFVDAFAKYVERWLKWMDQFTEEPQSCVVFDDVVTQSESVMGVGKEMLRVLKRGLQLLQRFAEKDFSFTICGSTGEFCEIIDDVKMYSKMMNKLLARDHVLEEVQGELDLDFSKFKNLLSSCYEKDKIALTKNPKWLSILQAWEEPQRLIIPRSELTMQNFVLGKGSFATVHKVLWLQVPVAIKQYRGYDYFQEEYDVLVELKARNCLHILQLIGLSEDIGPFEKMVGAEHEAPALVMELMDMDLKKLMEKKNKNNPVTPFSLWEATDIMLQIAMGIMHLHKQNIIHRDIKPANILVKTREDGSFIVKIADLGGSKTHFKSGTHSNLKGTPRYMAPEMRINPNEFCTEYTRKVDAFSFGKVCQEIFAGILSLIRSLPDGISKPLNIITHCCLEEEDCKRPTFEEICDRLWELKEVILTKGAPIQRHIDKTMKQRVREEKMKIERKRQERAAENFIAEIELKLKEPLGTGASAVVEKASWRGKPVAIKRYFYNHDFEAEYRIYTKLKDSSHIVQLLGHSEYDKRSGPTKSIVLELMDTDLRQLIRSKEDTDSRGSSIFSLYESIDIMYQIAKGMRSLHEFDVIHRDIKPKNILIKTREDRRFYVKLAGFSSSKADFQTEDMSHTARRGTLVYMAPEMFKGEDKHKYSRKVDAYSFGIVCIEILTGKTPYRGQVKNLQKGQMLALDIPIALGTIICECLQEDPNRRPTFKVICDRLKGINKSTMVRRERQTMSSNCISNFIWDCLGL